MSWHDGDVLKNNAVLHCAGDGCDYRVLWADRLGQSYWINLTRESNTPQAFDCSVVEKGIEDGTYTFAVDVWCPLADIGSMNEKEKAKQQRAWGLIGEAVESRPDIYDPARRSEMLKAIEEQTGVKRNNLYPYLGRYWRGGQTPDTLYPHLKAIGKSRDLFKEGSGRPGRKKKEGCPGKKLTREDTAIFAKGVSRFYLGKSHKSLSEAYKDMLREYYVKRDDAGAAIPLGADDIPSYFQFRYWYYKNRDVVDGTRKKEGDGEFERNHRAVLGKVETYAFGPGDKVQVDATIADIYLVRKNKRDAIVGRPTLYMMVDTVTHMAVGLYVTYDPPSMQGARMAIMNCAADKVGFCKRFGIDITPDQWPCRFLPKVIVADRGELESRQADVITTSLGITIENTPPYRGDLKPLVEQYFHLINVKLDEDIPGRVQPDIGERGAHDYRLDAILDIYQFTAIIIRIVLFYNNSHWLSGYERGMLLRQYSVPSVPRDIWNFEVNHRGGALTCVPQEKIITAIFPKGEAVVTERGIRFNGMYYICDKAVKEKWFEKARITGVETVSVSYNPSDAAFIYITAGNAVVECHLVEHHGMYVGLQTREVSEILGDDKELEGRHKIDELNDDVYMKDKIEEIIDTATAMAPDTSGMSKAARLAGMKENCQKERADSLDENTTRSLEAEGLIHTEATGTVAPAPAGNAGGSGGTMGQAGSLGTQGETMEYSPIEQILMDILEGEGGQGDGGGVL